MDTNAVVREPSNEAEARQIIDEISISKGHLDGETQEWLNSQPEQFRRKIKLLESRAVHNEAKNVTFTKKINNNDSHFIYEILQNADDAKYSQAKANDKKPFLRFKVSSKEIIIESNEDGFSVTNVHAICEAGESSKNKSADSKQIGEKGIGFKSVFLVADHVQIRSGLWAFHFEHGAEDEGIGMVTPIPDDSELMPADVGTRITLRLNDKYQKDFARLERAFSTLPATTTIFLQKISRVEFQILQSDGREVHKTVTRERVPYSSLGLSLHHETHEIGVCGRRDLIAEQKRRFQIRSASIDVTVALSDPRRTNSKTDITLAFPTDLTGNEPLTDPSGEHIFAFLPLQRFSQLPFLVQADFIASENRESIEECGWNIGICQGIVKTFCDAVEFFVVWNVFRYTWPVFVPRENMIGKLEFLRGDILSMLCNRSILMKQNRTNLGLPKDVFFWPQKYLHDMTPLFPDDEGSKGCYLANELQSSNFRPVLEAMGVKELPDRIILNRLQSDLAHSASKWKNVSSNTGWRNAVIKILLEMLAHLGDSALTVKELKLIGMINGTYTSALSWPYFPDLEGVEIPRDLGFQLVDPIVLLNPQTRSLYKELNVRSCESTEVIKRITAVHRRKGFGDLENAVRHLRFLYWHDPSWKPHFDMRVYTKSGILKSTSDVYFTSNEPYSTDGLIRESKKIASSKTMVTDQWLIHDCYIDDKLTDNSNRKNWKDWLRDVVGIAIVPRLLYGQGSDVKLSNILRWVLSISTPLFLENLRAHWTEYQSFLKNGDPMFYTVVQDTAVACGNGKTCKLSQTYLPTADTTSCEKDLGVANKLNIISLGKVIEKDMVYSWSFLAGLQVKLEPDNLFYLDALVEMGTSISAMAPLKAYELIGQKKCDTSSTAMLRFNFGKCEMIYIPSSASTGTFVKSGDCIWSGPTCLSIKHQLAVHYSKYEAATYLFKDLLGLRDADIQDVLDECQKLKASLQPDEDILLKARNLYTELVNMAKEEKDWNTIRTAFKDEKLIYARNGWFSPSDCLWSSSMAIEGKAILVEHYPGHEAFLVRHLKIRKADVGLLISELTRKAQKGRLHADEAKQFLTKISAMMNGEILSQKTKEELKSLSIQNCLPVRLGAGPAFLVGASDGFVILDHRQYAAAFSDRLRILDFTVEQIPQVHDLITELDMGKRLLSRVVKEKTIPGKDAEQDQNLTHNLREKAFALYCCATKYRSPKTLNKEETLFEQFKKIQIYTSVDISTKLTITQDGKELTSTSQQVSILLEPLVDGSFRLYLPRDETERRSCYRSKIPRLLLTIMELKNDDALLPVNLILNTSTDDMEKLLLDENIPEVSWIVKPNRSDLGRATTLQPDYTACSSHESERLSGEQTPVSSSSGILSSGTSVRPVLSNQWTTAQPVTPSRHATGLPLDPPRSAPPGYTRNDPQVNNRMNGTLSNFPGPADRYKSLLTQIIGVVQGPSTYDLTDLGRSLTQEFGLSTEYVFDGSSTFGPEESEKTFKIGAAGELYVFEQLQKLLCSQPNCQFDRGNWQSRIRKHVSVHPDYKDMDNWPFPEKSDIRYRDISGDLTRWLVRKCHGPCPEWTRLLQDPNGTNAGPDYFIEVKSTVNTKHDTTFYMSGNEHELMCKIHNAIPASGIPKEVYVIIRVYNLLTKDIDFKVFIDPRRDEYSEVLTFKADQWYVTPHTGSN